MDTVLLILNGGHSIVVAVTSSRTRDTERSIHPVPKFLQDPHEFIIHFVDATTATATHLGLAEVGSDHVNHDSPTARMKVLRRIRQQCQSFPSASNLERISETILSSMDVHDFADAHSASITKTLNTTRSDSIDTTRVFAHLASNDTITFSFQFQYVFLWR